MSRSVLRSLVVLVSLVASTLPLTAAGADDTRVTVDFEGLSGFVSQVAVGDGLGATRTAGTGDVSGTIAVAGDNHEFPGQNAAMIFDATCGGAADKSACPVDADLFFPRLGNVLIVSEDMDPSLPDDADLADSHLTFDFSAFGPGVVNVESITLLDIEELIEDAKLTLTLADGSTEEVQLPSMKDNEAKTKAVGVGNVVSMSVLMGGSGAIDNIELSLDQPPAVSVTKDANPESGTTLDPGSDLSYTILVTNTSPDLAAEGVLVTDEFDSEFVAETVAGCENDDALDGSSLNCVVNVPAGESTAVTVSGAIVGADAVDDCSLSNVAHIAFEGGRVVNATSGEVTHRIVPEACETDPEIALEKVAEPSQTPVENGSTISYTITATNSGEQDATAVAISDVVSPYLTVDAASEGCVIDGQDVTCTLDVPAGESVSVTIDTTVTDLPSGLDPTQCVIDNDVTTGFEDGDPSDNSSSVRVPGECKDPVEPRIQIDKEAAPASGTVLAVGDTVAYRIVARESAGVDWDNEISISDTLAAGLSLVSVEGCDFLPDPGARTVECVLPGLAASTSHVVTITARVAEQPAGCEIVNVAQMSSGQQTFTSGSVTHPVSPEACGPRLEVTKSAPEGPYDLGDDVPFTVTVTNVGGSSATNVRITDEFDRHLAFQSPDPDGVCDAMTSSVTLGEPMSLTCFIDEIPAGQSVAFRVTGVVIAIPANEPCEIPNAVTVTMNGSTTVHTAETSIVTDPPCIPDDPVKPRLTFLKTANPASGSRLATGQEFEYSLTVTATGDVNVVDEAWTDDIVIRDELHSALSLISVTGCASLPDPGSRIVECVITDDLPLGQSRTVTIRVRIDQRPADCLLPNASTMTSRDSSNGSDVSLTSSTTHEVDLPCTGLDADQLNFAMAFSMLIVGGLLLHSSGGLRPARRRDLL